MAASSSAGTALTTAVDTAITYSHSRYTHSNNNGPQEGLFQGIQRIEEEESTRINSIGGQQCASNITAESFGRQQCTSSITAKSFGRTQCASSAIAAKIFRRRECASSITAEI